MSVIELFVIFEKVILLVCMVGVVMVDWFLVRKLFVRYVVFVFELLYLKILKW